MYYLKERFEWNYWQKGSAAHVGQLGDMDTRKGSILYKGTSHWEVVLHRKLTKII